MSMSDKYIHLKIPLQEIKSATNNFSRENFIGGGGFGPVYKGELVVSNKLRSVAIKRLQVQPQLLAHGNTQFWKEIIALSRYKHEKIVSLLGFCDERGEKILVYKYASKGSLDSHIKEGDLNWETRLKICIGAARGLAYLHDPGSTNQAIVHRDIKSPNILLDDNWNAIISDFGLSEIMIHEDITMANPVGTPGYTDPVFAVTGRLSTGTDVYSFGVVLFEVLSGRINTSTNGLDGPGTLVLLVQQYFQQNNLSKIVDATIKHEIPSSSLQDFTTIAYQCLNVEVGKRPRMTEIVSKLEKMLQYHDELLQHKKGYDYDNGSNVFRPPGRRNQASPLFKREATRNNKCNFFEEDEEKVNDDEDVRGKKQWDELTYNKYSVAKKNYVSIVYEEDEDEDSDDEDVRGKKKVELLQHKKEYDYDNGLDTRNKYANPELQGVLISWFKREAAQNNKFNFFEENEEKVTGDEDVRGKKQYEQLCNNYSAAKKKYERKTIYDEDKDEDSDDEDVRGKNRWNKPMSSKYLVAKKKDDLAGGVQNRWLTAMKSDEVLANEISKSDEGALQYLKDVKCRQNGSEEFKLELHFNPNPYFKNSSLTKAYEMAWDEGLYIADIFGTDIDWFPGKNLTKNTKTRKCKSFFNFFEPPPPADEFNDDEDTIQLLENQTRHDYNIGLIIRDKIIPLAARWFIREPAQSDDDDDEDEHDISDSYKERYFPGSSSEKKISERGRSNSRTKSTQPPQNSYRHSNPFTFSNQWK